MPSRHAQAGLVTEDFVSARQDGLTQELVCYYSRNIGNVVRPHCEGAAVVAYGTIALCSMCDKMRSAERNVPRKLPAAELTELIEAARALRLAEQRVDRAARLARDAGASWSHLGDAVGISRQAAQQRFGRCIAGGLASRGSEST
jgi:hypothetical protein